VFELLSRIWTNSVLRVSDIEQIAGRFNAALAQAYVICMDEALFVGDRKSQDKMKSLITEPVISVEQKHQPQHSIESYHRYFSASNHEHFAQIENDDRRYFLLTVSSCHQQHSLYFSQLFKAIASDDVIAAFMHVLTNIDLRRFNPRAAPKTVAHSEQRMLSLTRFERYWYHALWAGELGDFSDCTRQWEAEEFISSQKLALAATKFDPNTSRYKPVTTQEVSKCLTRLCPSAKYDRRPPDWSGRSLRGYALPTLSVARREFELAKGVKVDWNDHGAPSDDTLPLKARLSGNRKPDEGGGFKEFARRTRHF
jgi:hypothetical protein